MISVEEAFQIVLQHPFCSQPEPVALLDASNRILAEDIVADRDFPPFNRVAMDGIAFLLEAINPSEIVLENTQYAGESQKSLLDTKACLEVMTGAVLPLGCDTVVRYEDVAFFEKDEQKFASITIPFDELKKGQNIHQQGIDKQQGQRLLAKGTKISPAEIAVIASVGKPFVLVESLPKVAVISTGDELVEINTQPQPHQIRMSNSYMLASALSIAGIRANLFHLIDHKELLSQKLSEILALHDIILLSGGVSVGKKDFVPEILSRLGVQKLFHKVAQKPGKPFWFGVQQNEAGQTTKHLFALPGNPVSTFLCFTKYALPIIKQALPKYEEVILAKSVFFKPPLTYFAPAKVYFENGQILAIPFEGSGSADFANLTECDGFVELSPEKQEFIQGERVKFIRFR